MIDGSHLISQVIVGMVHQQGNLLLRGWTSNSSRGSSLDCTSCSLPQKQSHPSILTLALRSLFRRPNNPMHTLWCFAKHTCISHHKAHLVGVNPQQYWKQQVSLQILRSWWFQPIWKICSSKLDPFPFNFGCRMNRKHSWVATTGGFLLLIHAHLQRTCAKAIQGIWVNYYDS